VARKQSSESQSSGKSQSFPDWIQPMAATLTQERFASPEWSFERKFDGIRLIAYKRGRDVRLFSRNQKPQKIPAVSQAIAKLAHRELILDGELTWHAPFTYHIFDIMWIDGHEVMSRPLEERRALLEQMPIATEPSEDERGCGEPTKTGGDKPRPYSNSPLRRVVELNDSSPWERAQKEGWEGVIAKRRGSVYEQRRSRDWVKMKCEMAQEFVVGGFTDPQGKRVGLGALLVGYYDGDDFVFAGKIGTGFDNQLLLKLREQLDRIELAKSPFTRAIGLPRLRAHWVRPKLVVQVGFIEWTVRGKLRHPRLLGVRKDKNAREVVRE
jgi:bifunctional non-homologous end joining protein LigD